MKNAVAKAVEILQMVAENMPAPTTVHELVDRLALIQSTCSTHLKTLSEYGLVTCVERRKGYVLGTAAYALAEKAASRHDLLAVAKDILERTGRALNEGLVLALWSRGRLLTPWVHQAEREVVVNHHGNHLDRVYYTASGRVLLAWQDDGERKRYMEKKLPEHWEWPEVANPAGLEHALALIRDQGHAVIWKKEMVSMAVPVLQASRIVAALGLSIPLQRSSEAVVDTTLATLRIAAHEMKIRLDVAGA